MAAETAGLGAVHLDVTDGERSLRFWRDLIGLELLRRSGDALHLGVAGEDLVVLHPGAERGVVRGHSGLYHLALHAPDAAEFAHMLARLFVAGYRHSPTEHVFSKATYLDDPDGIGLEITLETPENAQVMRVGARGLEVIDAQGRARAGVEALDVDEALGHLADRDFTRPVAAGTKVGHVHLHVADLDAAARFYRDALGFPEHLNHGPMGFADVHFGGAFKHRIAFNVWQGAGAPPRPAGVAGLRHFTLVLPGDAALAAALDRAGAAGHRVERRSGHAMVHDPAGNRLLVTAGSATPDP
jgi:catechol 2,3-dioxygenase